MGNTLLKSKYIFYFILFWGFYIFYAEVHPIFPFDADDWMNMNFTRGALPSLSNWNPTKVFPECFEPLAGLMAAYVVAPLVGDYLNALLYTHAFIVSTFIILYLYSLQLLLKKIFNFGDLTCYAIIIVYVLFHFLILRTNDSGNDYLLFSPNANCYYHYTIPNLLCASLVMWLMRNDIKKVNGKLNIGVILLAFYFALCSNLFATVILIAYIGAQLIWNLVIQDKKESNWLWIYIKQNGYFIFIVCFWLIIQLIEANGLRAAYSNMETPIISGTIEASKNFISLHFNRKFSALAFLSVTTALGYAYIKRKKDWNPIRKRLGILGLALVLDIVYLILLCSRVDPLYLQQGQVIFSYSFFILIIVILSISYVCSTTQYVKVGLPLLVFLFFFETNTTGKAFRDVQYEYIDNPQACMDLNRILLDKIKKADHANQDSILITVPDFGNWDNWPLSYNCSKVGIVLYKHNVISRPIRTIYRRSGVIHQISEPFYAY